MEPREYRTLHAEWYELRSGKEDNSEEIAYWARSIEESGGPALELGSGTGRVLLPLLERGLEVVGIDTSQEMTARCIAAGEAKGLKPEIHAQSMLEFDLSRAFGLIFLASGGLGLFTTDQDIEAMFERVISHLKPGGLFIYEFQPVPDKRPRDTREDWVRGPAGVLMTLRVREHYDSSSHVWEQLYIIEKFVDGHLLQTEANERTGRFFSVDEAVHYSNAAGFEEIGATDWLTTDPPDKDSTVITVRCRKPDGR